MHTHSEYSPDSRTPLAAQAAALVAAGIDVVCATDHNTIEGALRLRELATDRLRVIVGEEISSRDRLYHLRRDALERVWSQVDCIEIFNAREAFAADNRRAAAFAAQHRIPG